jgi:hypothetical protein
VIRPGVAAAALALAWGALPANAAELLGASFADGMLYDVDAATGAAANPRSIRMYACNYFCGDMSIPVTHVAGIESHRLAPAMLHVLTTVSGGALANALVSAPLPDPYAAFGAATPAGVQIGEGDLALEPSSGQLFAVGLTEMTAPFTLVRLPAIGGATVVGEIGFSDVSGLAFDAAGTLYALDTGSDALLVLDPSDASTLSTTPLSEPLGATAGMDYDPDTDTLYVADGGTGGRDALFTLDVATGALTEVGLLGLDSGLSGLAVVPEADAIALGGAALATLLLLERRSA